MKAYSKYIALAAVAVSFAACQQEEMDITTQDDLVRIEATVGNLPQTRVSYSDTEEAKGVTAFTEGDAIYVVNAKRIGMGKEAATYTYDGKNWNPDALLVWNGGTTLNNLFNAWYPASAHSGSFTLGSQTDGVGAFDLMTATTETINKTETLSLTFNHLLTKVTVNATGDTSWGDEIATNDQYFSEAKISTKTAITVNEDQDANTGWYTFSASGTGEASSINACIAEDGKSFTAIICPDTYAEGSYWLEVKAGTEETTRKVKLGSEMTLQAGKHYAFDLKVGKNKVTINSVTVSNWTTTTIDDAPDAEEVSPIDATSTDAVGLKSMLLSYLNRGYSSLEVQMTAEPADEMFTHIREALIAANVADGSISLTLSGVTVIPESAFYADEAGTPELKSIRLPDVVTISESAFDYSTNLTSLYAPHVQTVGKNAFRFSGLTEIDLPEATTLGFQAFTGCKNLTRVNLPKATVLGAVALHVIQVNSGELTIYLTSSDDLSVHARLFGSAPNYLDKINLVLDSSKASEVSDNVWTTTVVTDDETTETKSFTFKSVTTITQE